MKKYPELTPQQIEGFKAYAEEHGLDDWSTGITQEMSPEDVGDYLIARKKVKGFRNLEPQDVIDFENKLKGALPWCRMENSIDITPEGLRELADTLVSFIRKSLDDSNSEPMTVGK